MFYFPRQSDFRLLRFYQQFSIAAKASFLDSPTELFKTSISHLLTTDIQLGTLGAGWAMITLKPIRLNKLKQKCLKGVEGGAPQGSILNALLFLIYVDDIHNIGLRGRIFRCKLVHNIGPHTIEFEQSQHGSVTRVGKCRLEITEERVGYKGSLECTSLPVFLKNSASISSFKRELKQRLLQNIEMLQI
uniref:Reverse transcriptase domain-containing protein n=1 Tax=Glossina pallidipes TaxID=7398 RepID=A0A1A9Z8B3_GLOPL